MLTQTCAGTRAVGLCRNDTNAEVNAVPGLSARRCTARVWCLLNELKKKKVFLQLGVRRGDLCPRSHEGRGRATFDERPRPTFIIVPTVLLWFAGLKHL